MKTCEVKLAPPAEPEASEVRGGCCGFALSLVRYASGFVENSL